MWIYSVRKLSGGIELAIGYVSQFVYSSVHDRKIRREEISPRGNLAARTL